MSQKMYAVTATVMEVKPGKGGLDWTTTRQVPTFYLHPNVQGLLTEERAVQVGRKIVDPLDLASEVHVTAVEVEV